MISNSVRLSKSEWRQVSGIAAQMNWARHSADFRNAEFAADLDNRTATALNQLLRFL